MGTCFYQQSCVVRNRQQLSEGRNAIEALLVQRHDRRALVIRILLRNVIELSTRPSNEDQIDRETDVLLLFYRRLGFEMELSKKRLQLGVRAHFRLFYL